MTAAAGVQLGQHEPPTHLVAHFSDPHLLAGGRRQFDRVDSTGHLIAALEQFERSGLRPDAIVFTGDLADLGEEDAYARLRDLVTPVVERLGAQLVWCMGNHDERAPYARILFGEDVAGDGSAGIAPQDRVHDVNGLRIVALDSSVPGYHHGELEATQLDWLREVLATPAEHGTLLALHHPPIPSPLDPLMEVIELQGQERLADVVRGTDVRGVLGGHLHYSTHSMFAGVPVSVASATCYTMALGLAEITLGGYDRFQSVDTVHVYADRLVHTTVSIGSAPLLNGLPTAAIAFAGAMTPDERLDMLSRKDSPWNRGEVDPAEVLAGAGLGAGTPTGGAVTTRSEPLD